MLHSKTFHIMTLGCQMNYSDSERIEGVLLNLGLKKEADKTKADLVILNTCGVRQAPEDRVYGQVPLIKRKNPKAVIIITGCLAHRKDLQQKLVKADYFINILELPDRLKQLLKPRPNSPQLSPRSQFFKENPEYASSFAASIPIMTGCNNFCAYCVVPYARGREFSRKPAPIIKEAKRLIQKGYKDLILLGQNVNSYQPGANSLGIKDFPDLLRTIAQIPGDFWLTFITSHPKDMSAKLIQAVKEEPKIKPYIHLPFQAGSNRIIKAMNRKYTQAHYLGLVKKIREAIPDVSLTTDVIVGFPGETLKDFEETRKVMQESRFDMAYISQYSPRPQTAAMQLKDDVPKIEKKRRKENLTQILRETGQRNNQRLLKTTQTVLIEKKITPKPGKPAFNYLGKTNQFKNVKIKSKKKLPTGSFQKVTITKVSDFGLEGKI